ncbi:MAG: hypothetical protein HXY48_06010 [Ignavibacteriaceae bacterium]|nr:hypothetical protein [Ignavibacteriaceae bacterium]
MKNTRHTTTNFIVKDSSGCFWLFGLFFVVIAGTFVIGLIGAFNNLNELSQLEQTAAWIISLSGVAAGIWIIYSNPAIKSDFDKREDAVRINRRSFMKNENEQYPLKEIYDIVINESTDDEGLPIFSVDMKLNSGTSISLTKTWLRNKKDLEENIKQIKDFLGKG